MTAATTVFIPRGPRSSKVMCASCGRFGYDERDPWAASCRAGHPFTCTACGKSFADRYGQGQHTRRTGHLVGAA